MGGEALEYQVLSAIRDRFVFLKYVHILRKEIFESYPTRYVYELIRDFHSSHDTGTITIRSLRILLNSKIKADEKTQFRGLVRRIRRNQVTDPAVIDELIKRFVKKQLLKHAVMTAVDSLESGDETDLERVRQRIDEAIQIDGADSEESYDWMHDPYQRITEESNERRIATRVSSELDQHLSGGLAAGEIGIVIAPTGVGKTLTLVNFGYGAMSQGRKVVHVTLEISARKTARRYDLRTARCTFDELRSNPNILKDRQKKLTRLGAGLEIKDYTKTLCSVADLRAYLERLRAKGKSFDLLIVDHIDLMHVSKAMKERRHELSSIVAGLRRLGAEFKVPVWTASQATRKAGEAGRTKLWDIAEDIGKANWADVAITISQNDTEKEDQVAYLTLAKTRLGRSNPRIQVFLNYDTMTMKGAKKDARDIIKRKLRDS